MSRLGRPDVLPVGDFAVRKGFQLTYDLEEMPKPKALADYGLQRIDVDSKQLAEAIAHGTNIIITTLQKFPFAIRHLSEIPDRKYAVIIDEAHSSQGGNASRKMNETLAGKNVSLEDAKNIETYIENAETDSDDFIRETVRKQGRQPNISLYAFTATPKARTLEVFGVKDADGSSKPFHLYSMRQAIEEGFILDVLKNYVSYKEYYRFSKQIEADPELEVLNILCK